LDTGYRIVGYRVQDSWIQGTGFLDTGFRNFSRGGGLILFLSMGGGPIAPPLNTPLIQGKG